MDVVVVFVVRVVGGDLLGQRAGHVRLVVGRARAVPGRRPLLRLPSHRDLGRLRLGSWGARGRGRGCRRRHRCGAACPGHASVATPRRGACVSTRGGRRARVAVWKAVAVASGTRAHTSSLSALCSQRSVLTAHFSTARTFSPLRGFSFSQLCLAFVLRTAPLCFSFVPPTALLLLLSLSLKQPHALTTTTAHRPCQRRVCCVRARHAPENMAATPPARCGPDGARRRAMPSSGR